MTRLHQGSRRSAGRATLLCVSFICGSIACSSNSAPPPGAPVTPTMGSAVGAAGGAAPGVVTGAAGSGITNPTTPATPNGPTATAGGGAPTTPGPDQEPGIPTTPTTPTTPTMPTTPTTPTMPTTPTTPGASEWTSMGFDASNSYNNIYETKLTKENAANLAVAYTVDMGGNVYGAPLMIGETIYASGSAIRALEAATGKEIWRAMVGTTGSMAYADGTLYLNGSGGKLVALNAMDGKQLWAVDSDAMQAGDGTSSPAVVGEVVVVGGSSGGAELGGGTFRGYIAGHDRKTGKLLWTTYTVPAGAKGASVWSSPSGDATVSTAYVGTGNNYGAPATDTSDSFIALDLMTGTVKWKAQRVMSDTFGGIGGSGPDADFGANPVLYETLVGGAMTKLISAGNKGGSAHAVKREDGMLVWTRMLCPGTADGSKGVFTNSTWSGKNMIFACNEGGPSTLYGLDGATGDIAWMRKLDALVWGRISVANGVGFVGNGTKLEAFDVATGALIKSWPSKGGTIASTFSIANGRVAFGEGLSWSSGVAGRTLTVLALP
ncbi:MAG TPA: PQQ-binding-like beta-propeller repeat protein [Polyangiales bacterium]|nr:PQQ-binding-like beta-propeller repeat protein [Polyangiales bacterium]